VRTDTGRQLRHLPESPSFCAAPVPFIGHGRVWIGFRCPSTTAEITANTAALEDGILVTRAPPEPTQRLGRPSPAGPALLEGLPPYSLARLNLHGREGAAHRRVARENVLYTRQTTLCS
jgi:hypothetical protein